MNINFSGSVIFAKDFEKMKQFYADILQQPIVLDFGTCITFKGGLTLWQLMPEYPISQKLGYEFSESGNKNLELCFETEDFDSVVENVEKNGVKFLHHVEEEKWGQRTIRIYDPENNLMEIGESIPCFVKRFYKQGLTIEETAARTSVSVEMVKAIVGE